METTTKEIKIQAVKEEVRNVIKRHGLTPRDIGMGLYLEDYSSTSRRAEQDKLWESLKGMWKHKKIDPIKYQRKIRKELERKLPKL